MRSQSSWLSSFVAKSVALTAACGPVAGSVSAHAAPPDDCAAPRHRDAHRVAAKAGVLAAADPVRATGQLLPTQRPAEAALQEERREIRLGKILAVSAGVVAPGVGQVAQGKEGLGGTLAFLGVGGLGTALSFLAASGSENVGSSDREAYEAAAATGAIVWGVAYFIGVFEALGEGEPGPR
jgi:hypothetical protein